MVISAGLNARFFMITLIPLSEGDEAEGWALAEGEGDVLPEAPHAAATARINKSTMTEINLSIFKAGTSRFS